MIKKCDNCHKDLLTFDTGCPSCGCQSCYYVCERCRRSGYSARCSTPGCGAESAAPPDLAPPTSVVRAAPVPSSPLVVREAYSAGSFGVTAEVRMVPGDVDVLNDLGKLEVLLTACAVRTNQLVGHTDHTRKIIKDMRALALEVREEIELRCGPPGGR